MQQTKVYGSQSKARVLVIGHDPRLQRSGRIAEYCFFADYFFRPIPTEKRELAKYRLAESLFSYIGWLTSYRYTPAEMIITNLCNTGLDRDKVIKGKTILIPMEYAKEGLATINQILKSSRIELIIAMSQQVNYLLLELGFYFSTPSYMKKSKPKEKAAKNGYYEPVGESPFLEICGNKYMVGNRPIYPVLHVKQFPFRRAIKDAYEIKHFNCINSIKGL